MAREQGPEQPRRPAAQAATTKEGEGPEQRAILDQAEGELEPTLRTRSAEGGPETASVDRRKGPDTAHEVAAHLPLPEPIRTRNRHRDVATSGHSVVDIVERRIDMGDSGQRVEEHDVIALGALERAGERCEARAKPESGQPLYCSAADANTRGSALSRQG